MNNVYRYVITQTQNADLEKTVYSHTEKLKEDKLWGCVQLEVSTQVKNLPEQEVTA